jgi:hypothetical protein
MSNSKQESGAQGVLVSDNVRSWLADMLEGRECSIQALNGAR